MSRFWKVAIVASMTVPEAATDLNNRAVFRKYDIGSARKTPVVKTEPITQSVQRPPQCHLRFGVAGSDAAHHIRSFCNRKDVRHLDVQAPTHRVSNMPGKLRRYGITD
jgi:hypothetical protein